MHLAPASQHTHMTSSVALFSPWQAPTLDVGYEQGHCRESGGPCCGGGGRVSTGRDAQAPCLPTEPGDLQQPRPGEKVEGGGQAAAPAPL